MHASHANLGLQAHHQSLLSYREVEAAAARESSTSRSGLHLVVMGHVDAGKSTLMGRLLHDLGHVSQKEAHKNLKEATQAGKVLIYNMLNLETLSLHAALHALTCLN